MLRERLASTRWQVVLSRCEARVSAGLAAVLAMTASTVGRAEQLPLWEAGLGVGVVDFADYRGADERSTYVLPLPYFVGLRENVWVNFEVYLSGSRASAGFHGLG